MYRRIAEAFLSVAGIEEGSSWAKMCASGICQATLSCAVGSHVDRSFQEALSEGADATVVTQPDAGQERSQGPDENPELES
jgi:methionine synthase I (cobalamin-dependent)